MPPLDNGVQQVSSIFLRYERDVLLERVEECEVIDVQVGTLGRLDDDFNGETLLLALRSKKLEY